MSVVESVPVVPLAQAAGSSVERVGAKAHALGRLVSSGVAVPEGLVLTTRLLADVLAANGMSAATATEEDVLTATWPESVAAAVVEVAERFGDAPMAVRSSAVAEDGGAASFAGQYESVLDVRGASALEEAVRRCWASAFTARVGAYAPARSSGGRDRASMAVLVQRLVDADAAGVAFTADPVTGSREEVVISAVPGLGEPVASGAVDADEWRVRDGVAVPTAVSHLALTRQQAHAIADLALEVERLLGGPQDLEWAMADHRMVVLQARPVTALPTPPRAVLPPGIWIKESNRYPEPFHAYGAGLAARAVSEGLTAVNREYGGMVERFDVVMIGGEAYVQVTPVGGHRGPPPPWWVLALLSRVDPALRRRMRLARRMLAPAALTAVMDDFDGVQQPRMAAEHRRLSAIALDRLSDAELGAHLDTVRAFVEDALALHFRLIPAEIVPVFDLVEFGRSRLGWGTAATLELLAGASATTTEPSTELALIASLVRSDPHARSALEGTGRDLLERMAAADAGLGRRLGEWCERYAVRCLNDDPATPTLAERPELIAALLREQVAVDPDEQKRAGRTAASARARAGDALDGDTDELDRLLSMARRAHALRETSAFWTSSMPAGLVRYAMVEAGRRLCARGLLRDPDDAAHVDADMVRSALAGDPAAVSAVPTEVARNRAERAWVLQHPGPDVVGGRPPEPPDLRGLPAAGRRLNQAMLWSQTAGGEPPSDGAESALVGLAAGSGRHTGPVRIVHGPHEFDRVHAGDVLVCPTTDPAWSVLFGIAGALVTDRGSLLSHAAIVAREYGLPAVLGTGAGTTTLVDGEVVTVDGTIGRVTREA